MRCPDLLSPLSCFGSPGEADVDLDYDPSLVGWAIQARLVRWAGNGESTRLQVLEAENAALRRELAKLQGVPPDEVG
jgi:hypothetical protein